jgi:hypothetical protein
MKTINAEKYGKLAAIIEMARKYTVGGLEFDAKGLAFFVDAIRADEREISAKQLDALGCDHCAEVIRARGNT